MASAKLTLIRPGDDEYDVARRQVGVGRTTTDRGRLSRRRRSRDADELRPEVPISPIGGRG